MNMLPDTKGSVVRIFRLHLDITKVVDITKRRRKSMHHLFPYGALRISARIVRCLLAASSQIWTEGSNVCTYNAPPPHIDGHPLVSASDLHLWAQGWSLVWRESRNSRDPNAWQRLTNGFTKGCLSFSEARISFK